MSPLKAKGGWDREVKEKKWQKEGERRWRQRGEQKKAEKK